MAEEECPGGSVWFECVGLLRWDGGVDACCTLLKRWGGEAAPWAGWAPLAWFTQTGQACKCWPDELTGIGGMMRYGDMK